MHMTGSPVSPEQGESDRDNVVLRCERYREAFLLLLNAPFEDLDDMNAIDDAEAGRCEANKLAHTAAGDKAKPH